MADASVPDPASLRQIAEAAALRAGSRLLEAFQDRPRDDVEEKAQGDFVTAIDREVEAMLRDFLCDATPDAGFLGEESGWTRPDAPLQWVVDPIDGTSNFAQGLRLFAVSIAAMVDRVPVAAACWSPDDGLYGAAVGQGANHDGKPLIALAPPSAPSRLIACQWFRRTASEATLQTEGFGWIEAVLESGSRVRSLGSTVLQVLHTAAGRYHANLQPLGRIWDLAAVALIAEEAGLRAVTWTGEPLFPGFLDASERIDPSLDRSSLIAADPLCDELLALVRPDRIR